MAIYYLGCDAYLTHQIQNSPDFYRHEVAEIELSIGATNLQIDRLIIGPTIQNLTQFTATISDWNLPPVALLILPEKNFDGVVDSLNHHPRVGRSIFICKDIAESVSQSRTGGNTRLSPQKGFAATRSFSLRQLHDQQYLTALAISDDDGAHG
jgi:hypothetical protein